jgi:adenine-specific DNA-methyltransferase
MNFIEFESKQKLRGGFYTESALAAFLVRWIKAIRPKSLLEPSCGDGAFLEAIERASIPTLTKITACELDSIEAAKASERTRLRPHVLNRDFLRWYLFHARDNEQFDAVVGNPPFIRYQYLPNEQQLLAEKIFEQLRLPFTKHTNAWVPFVLASAKLLRPGGRLAMVIPSEIFHIPHAQSLRRYLAEQCSHVLVLDPQEIWFGETLQGTTLLLAQKKNNPNEKSNGVAIIAANRKTLAGDPEGLFRNAAYTNGATIEGKWMPIFLSVKERAVIAELRKREDIKPFRDLASVDVGIVTGANKFFLVPDKTVQEFELQKWAHPMFGRSEHVSGLIYSKEDHRANRRNGLPANFLWFKKNDLDSLPSNVRRYLKTGLSENLHTRFKCRTRKVWYQVPSVYTAPVAMLKRAHHYPRLVLNAAQAYTTDTAYRIVPRGVTSESLVFGFVNSLTCLCAEMEGRHYGGGVLELVPSEIERLLVPLVKVTKQELSRVDQQFRDARDHLSFLKTQDRTVFGKLGVSIHEQEILNAAWMKLRDRRHRVSTIELEQAVA